MNLYGVQKQQLRSLTKQEYLALRQITRLAKNMYNVGLYNVRQHYFSEKKFLPYTKNNQLSKSNKNYQALNTDAAQQILKKVEENFQSFFSLLKGNHPKPRIPKYLKKDDFFEISYPRIKIQDDDTFFLPMSPVFKKEYGKINIKIPSNLLDKKICEIRIHPRYNASFFEIEYVYIVERESPPLSVKNLLSIDLGIDNFASVVTTTGASFLLDGKAIKSINQWYNKHNSELQSIKIKQGIKELTKQQMLLLDKRNHYLNDFLNKAVRYLVNHCIDQKIGTMILGYNKGWKDSINIGRANNQRFLGIPHGKLSQKLESMCERYGIQLIRQEESYTSKADFLAQDDIPTFEEGKKYTFSGKRIKRGLYQSKTGALINADINGAANILRKSGLPFDLKKLIKTVKLNPIKVRLTQTSKHRPSGECVEGRLAFLKRNNGISTTPSF
jgi:putative transposase